MHAAMRRYLKTGRVDDLSEDFFPYWEQMHEATTALDLREPLWIEGPVTAEFQHLQQGEHAIVWSKKLGYGGTPDVVTSVGGVPVVVEFKTSDCLFQDHYTFKQFDTYAWMKFKHAALQCAAYRNAFTETTGLPIDAAIIIVATKDEHQTFVLEADRLNKSLKDFHKMARAFNKH